MPFDPLPELVHTLRPPPFDINVRFTRTPSALYILSLGRPSTPIFILSDAKLPIVAGDRIFLLGANEGGEVQLDWEYRGEDGELRILVSGLQLGPDREAWVFRCDYS